MPAAIPVVDWAENVAFDEQGNLWVSRTMRNAVQRYDSSGKLTATVPVEFPGAARMGPDGLLYVVYGDAPTSMVTRDGGVVRFDPAAADPRPTVFASGFAMPNGAAFDANGNLYVAATGSGVIRIRPNGTVDTEWTARATNLGANGIAINDNSIYLTVNANPLGRIIQFPIDDPSHRSVVADLSSPLPGIPDFADDLLIDDSGILYVATATGQLVRVDPNTNTACAVLSGEPITSVTAVPGKRGHLLASTERGAVLSITLRD